ncbi:DUF3175 domain-containing protein [Chitinasiproducens palmae]|uniref:DUF3175 domain-containing protein n=1 Tax=Chitinasiproducens palmae TaxID=1770053 RepID=A0A1H2PVV7_9BURK|nr:DUF3175 domain-containing protein [Chitinasiproducens palmae]SDV51013.1 Protein of unknown function [Chitinasiproducens palmae]
MSSRATTQRSKRSRTGKRSPSRVRRRTARTPTGGKRAAGKRTRDRTRGSGGSNRKRATTRRTRTARSADQAGRAKAGSHRRGRSVRHAKAAGSGTHRRTAASTPDRWSQRVTEHSDAMDLENGVFKQHDPERLARSVKASAERSRRRRGTPFQSAMSMLNFYGNRARRNLSRDQKAVLQKAKDALRALYGREPKPRT